MDLNANFKLFFTVASILRATPSDWQTSLPCAQGIQEVSIRYYATTKANFAKHFAKQQRHVITFVIFFARYNHFPFFWFPRITMTTLLAWRPPLPMRWVITLACPTTHPSAPANRRSSVAPVSWPTSWGEAFGLCAEQGTCSEQCACVRSCYMFHQIHTVNHQ